MHLFAALITGIYFLVYFIYQLIKNIVVYTLSVIPASCQDAWNDTRRLRNNSRIYSDGFDNSAPPRPGTERKHHRNRRGHRGGRKHHKKRFQQ